MSSTRSKIHAAVAVALRSRVFLLAHAQRLLAELAINLPHHEVEHALDEVVPWFALGDDGGDLACFAFFPEHFKVTNYRGEVLLECLWEAYSPGSVLEWFMIHADGNACRPLATH